MAKLLTPREATEMILANRLRHSGGGSDGLPQARRQTSQPQSTRRSAQRPRRQGNKG